MTTFSNSSQLQANNALNGILSKVLPGSSKLTTTSSKKYNKKFKGSKAQLINNTLKKRVELQKRDVIKIRKNERKLRKQQMKSKKLEKMNLEQMAKLEILKKHQMENSLTTAEQKYLNKLVRKNESNLKSWELDEEDKEELQELQDYIIGKVSKSSKLSRRKGKGNKRQVNDELIATIDADDGSDRAYPGLTPGLAPVDLSDEEDSSEEEEDFDDD
ncbi:hypothetical protein TBLA_0E03750 [Henningerozyma blattae CBS 6284]|uniref:Regulator of rDNA transcription 14 n=1 Tax=Henningerozyma blattae (strain ATCC 34711 / CBS 6284 / DSM 70876 / NBRC 10599 / NRRL Y-10934 / UCD 77-7) TaxID=1071380 RepID=I2H4X7_HENB6|nr:hypothetical protein TBLA_0E03750 [Tetrapisispora blattae CBS 6284]CCH61429.1 hypothetical protein TBLA_0E03750 [Tetrapisispora blattae CBS 6284]